MDKKFIGDCRFADYLDWFTEQESWNGKAIFYLKIKRMDLHAISNFMNQNF